MFHYPELNFFFLNVLFDDVDNMELII